MTSENRNQKIRGEFTNWHKNWSVESRYYYVTLELFTFPISLGYTNIHYHCR